MIDTGTLGKEIYFINVGLAKVEKGIVYAIHIGVKGYVTVTLLSEKVEKRADLKNCFLTKDSSEQRLIEIVPHLSKVKILNEKAKKESDIITELVIGKPDFADLAKDITVGSK